MINLLTFFSTDGCPRRSVKPPFCEKPENECLLHDACAIIYFRKSLCCFDGCQYKCVEPRECVRAFLALSCLLYSYSDKIMAMCNIRL